MTTELLPIDEDAFRVEDGIYIPVSPVMHREEGYASEGFDSIRKMQDRHFWYRGRHRFLHDAVQRYLPRLKFDHSLRAVDLGGGCGGWLAYLSGHGCSQIAEVALADSSIKALQYAAEFLPPNVRRYQIDLLNLPWRERWEVAFLLDVLEHIPDDENAMVQIRKSLTPGGLLFVTTPALQRFWTYNDDAVHHQRRYSKRDFHRLAARTGYKLLTARYFMFFLSPLLLGSRWLQRPPDNDASPEKMLEILEKTHRVPRPVVNLPLTAIFSLETPLGHLLPFPWGTSILGCFQAV